MKKKSHGDEDIICGKISDMRDLRGDAVLIQFEKRRRNVMNPLHDRAATLLLRRSVGVVVLGNLTRWLAIGPREFSWRSWQWEKSHTGPHTDGTIKSRVLLQ